MVVTKFDGLPFLIHGGASGNCLRKLYELYSTGMLPNKNFHIAVHHDPWCKHLKGGECDCDPDLVLREINVL